MLTLKRLLMPAFNTLATVGCRLMEAGICASADWLIPANDIRDLEPAERLRPGNLVIVFTLGKVKVRLLS